MTDFASLPGNAAAYDVSTVRTVDNHPLRNEDILFLGSSVTLGAASLEQSFADFIAKRSGAAYLKEAVNGTTLVDIGPSSYVARLKNVDVHHPFTLFVCQLSTNDSNREDCPVGTVGDTGTDTVCGAIRTITRYVIQTWHCPVVFYTGSYYDREKYAAMVQALLAVTKEEGITVADLYTDASFNAVSQEQYALYMADPVHPTKAGYLEWWVPRIEEAMIAAAQK